MTYPRSTFSLILTTTLIFGCSGEDGDDPDSMMTGGSAGTAATPGGGGSGGMPITTGGTGGSPPLTPCDAQTTILAVDQELGGCSGAGCHTAGNFEPFFAPAGMETPLLDTVSTQGDCSGQKYIDSANVENSLMINKLMAVPVCGVAMPFLKDPLTQDKVDCIRSWVTQIASGQ